MRLTSTRNFARTLCLAVQSLVAFERNAAARLARRGVSMAVRQLLLGHQTIEMTARHYTRLEVEDLRAAIEVRAGQGSGREALG